MPGALPFRANYSQGEQPLSLFAGEAGHRSGRSRTGQVWGALSRPKPHTELPPQTGAASPLRLGCSLPGYKGAANAVQSSPRYKNRSLSVICFSSKAAEANYTATNYHALILLSSPWPGCRETRRCLPIPLPPRHGHFQRWHCLVWSRINAAVWPPLAPLHPTQGAGLAQRPPRCTSKPGGWEIPALLAAWAAGAELSAQLKRAQSLSSLQPPVPGPCWLPPSPDTARRSRLHCHLMGCAGKAPCARLETSTMGTPEALQEVETLTQSCCTGGRDLCLVVPGQDVPCT